MGTDLADRERKCNSQTQEILTLTDQVQRLTAELKQVSGAREDLSQSVRYVTSTVTNYLSVM